MQESMSMHENQEWFNFQMLIYQVNYNMKRRNQYFSFEIFAPLYPTLISYINEIVGYHLDSFYYFCTFILSKVEFKT